MEEEPNRWAGKGGRAGEKADSMPCLQICWEVWGTVGSGTIRPARSLSNNLSFHLLGKTLNRFDELHRSITGRRCGLPFPSTNRKP